MPLEDQTPQVILISDETNAIILPVSGPIPSGTPGLLTAGIFNGTTASFLKLDSQNSLFITGSVTVNNPGSSGPGGNTPIDSVVGVTASFSPISAAFVAGVDSSGSFRGIKTNYSGSVLIEDFYTSLAHGLISSSINFFIGTATVASTTDTRLFPTSFYNPTSSAKRSIKSTSANDTAAGTGVRTLKLTYYSFTGDGPFVETFSLNGTTAVNSVNTNIGWIEKIEGLTVGTNSSSVGAIQLWSEPGGIGAIMMVIAAAQIRSTYGLHYTNRAKKTLLTNFNGGGPNPGRFLVKVADPTVANEAEQINGGIIRNSTAANGYIEYKPPLIITGFKRVIIYWSGDSSTSTAIQATVQYVELDA